MIAKGEEIKIVYIDGSLSNGITRSIRGVFVSESDNTITIERRDGKLTIGKNFIIKIENWKNGRGQFDY